MAITPGTYLRLRRVAAGLSIDDVAMMIATEPRMDAIGRAEWLRLIEADVADIGAVAISALRYAFAFDAMVLIRLGDLRTIPDLTVPRICINCGCSANDSCKTLGRCGCDWASEDLCTECVSGHPGEAEASPPIDDEDADAAPSPDADNDGQDAERAA